MGYYNDNWEWISDDEANQVPYEPPPQTVAPPPVAPTPPPAAVPPAAGGGGGMDQADADLRAAGYVQQPDGSWYNPAMDRGGGGGYGSAPDRSGFSWPSYSTPNYRDPGPFDPGPAFSYKDFVAPTGETMLKEPGFQFRLDQGRKALEASAAGKGILRSGGTLKDILGYGQNFASQEFGNVYNRALQEYDTNRNNAADAWGKSYGQRKDVYGFHADNVGRGNTFNLANAQNEFSGKQRQAEAEFQDSFNRWRAQGDWLSGMDD